MSAPSRSAADLVAAETTARILLETKSVLFSPEKPFTFTSGRSSPVYIDCRRLISFPRARRQLMESLSIPVGYGVEFSTLVDTAAGRRRRGSDRYPGSCCCPRRSRFAGNSG